MKRKNSKSAQKINKNDKALKEKIQIFNSTFPKFEQQKNEFNQQITNLETQLAELKNQKKKLMKEFENKCIHKYGDEYTEDYGCYTYVDCIHCGYKNCIREMNGN